MIIILNRFRPMKFKHDEWKGIITKFKEEQDYDKAYKSLLSGDALRSFFLTKSKAQKQAVKEHVSILCKYFISVIIAINCFSE